MERNSKLRPQPTSMGSLLVRTLLTFLTISIAPPVLSADWTVSAYSFAGLSTRLSDINASGQIVGSADTADDIVIGLFIDRGTTTVLSGPTGAKMVTASGISDEGLIVGSWLDDSNASHGYLYANGQYEVFDLSGADGTTVDRVSANGRYLTGSYWIGDVYFEYAYDRDIDYLYSFESRPAGANLRLELGSVNSKGLAAGFQIEIVNGAPIWSGLIHDLGSGITTLYPATPVHAEPRFYDLNDSGLLTGYMVEQARAKLLVGSPTQGYELFSLPNAMHSWGLGMNDQGWVVGQSQMSDGHMVGIIAIPSAVPEPRMAVLSGSGLLALLALARKRASPAA